MRTLILRQTAAGLRILVALTIVCGIGYPLATWAVSRIPGLQVNAEGSQITDASGTVVGSSLIGVDPVPADPNADPWFHTRPSAGSKDVLGPGDPAASGGSNKSAFNDDLVKAVDERRAQIAAREGVDPAQVPPDAVTASGSGLDPDISPDFAQLQVVRVARVTGLSQARVEELVAQASSGRMWGFLGEPTVNVTELNVAVAAAR